MQQITVSGRPLRLPDFIIAGAAKSGTTSLVRYLSGHPRIAIPPGESQFFAFLGIPPAFRKMQGPGIVSHWEAYRAYLPRASNSQLLGEKSVGYLYVHWFKTVIGNLQKYYPDPRQLKIVILLRNPVERAYSQYLNNRNFYERLPFAEAVRAWEKRKAENWVPAYDYVGGGLYYEAVKAYAENFPQTKVFFHEALDAGRTRVLRELFEFLGVDASFVPENISGRFNVSAVPKNGLYGLLYNGMIRYNPARKAFRKLFKRGAWERIKEGVKKAFFARPPMYEEAGVELSGLFKEDLLKLQGLLRKDLSHWMMMRP